jgi:hypothetical protein
MTSLAPWSSYWPSNIVLKCAPARSWHDAGTLRIRIWPRTGSTKNTQGELRRANFFVDTCFGMK